MHESIYLFWVENFQFDNNQVGCTVLHKAANFIFLFYLQDEVMVKLSTAWSS